MKVFPNVKLNLGLRVIRRRPDGYHDIETLFVPYDGYSDELQIERSDRFSLVIDGQHYQGWDVAGDLTARAWKLLADECGIDPVSMRLTKNAPVGAGLGGGSADAAFALRALDALFGLGLGDAALAAFAARLGSDCPFFIYNRPMLASGRGEVLEPFDIDLSGYRIEVAVPEGVAVSTREAYAGLKLGSEREETASEGGMPLGGSLLQLSKILKHPVAEWRDLLVNDFERSVFPAHPEIAALKESFYNRGAAYSAMSGSGSAVFALFPLNP